MDSFRAVTYYIPQCQQCGTAVLDEHGQELRVDYECLASEQRDRLRAGGWHVFVPKRDGRRRWSTAPKETLTCPACCARNDEQLRLRRDDLHRPLVATVDLAARLGAGWQLGQRAGDVDTHTWLLYRDGAVAGMVCRYRRADESWSRGWVAWTIEPAGYGRMHVPATAAGGLRPNSSYLWRSRDLAAWGVAARPTFGTPVPEWSRRRAT